jgi:signal transduction histidine kinase
MNQDETPKLSITPCAALEQQLAGPQVLIVDDETVIGDICSRALSSCRVSHAENGRQALHLIANNDFDLILTDVNMPDMGGLELLRTIKEQKPNQPVIVMTGYACRETILEALKADADDFINKPFNLLHLQTLVNKTLEKKALKDELLQLRLMDRLKTDFLGMISHKLNNPVTAISLFFQNMAHNAFDLNDPIFREHLNLMHQESENLVSLIQSLLVYSDLVLDIAPLEKVPADLARIIHETLAEMQKDFTLKDLTVSVKAPDDNQTTPMDQRRIRFVIRALLNNAISASKNGSTINVDLSITSSTSTLIITDSGPGIPKEEQSKIFEKFYQFESASSPQTKGFGLGLYYARLFTKMHDGTLTLKSSTGRGAVFIVSLPR